MLILVIILIVGILFFLAKPKNIGEKSNIDIAIDTLNKNLDETQDNEREKYYDKKYKYSLEYSSKYKATPIEEKTMQMSKDLGGGSFVINGGVLISDYSEGPWFFVIHIFENPEASTLKEYLEQEDSQFDYIHVIVDKELEIDGNKAISYHKKSDYEQFPESEKYIIFLKDRTLFKIITRGNKEEQEKFLNSLKFNQ